MSHQLLIIDDDRTVCQSLELLFRRKGYGAKSVFGVAEALKMVEQSQVDLVVMDMNFSVETSGRQGLKLLEQLLELKPGLPIILMTGWATVQLAVEGMKKGARDFVAKPWDNRALLESVQSILALQDGTSTGNLTPFGRILTQSDRMEEIMEMARRVAATDASVLITGESGTGKELVAEAIHAAGSRAAAPLVAVNLGGVPESLFESEMFGHRAGAFTDARSDRKGRFELAEGGTLFLDEVGDLAAPNQVKLLRVLQERRYERLGESMSRPTDVRIISATSRSIEELVDDGTFREDLFYRINLIHLRLPALRERHGDTTFLARHFLKSAAERYGKPELSFDSEVMNWLERQDFPGNIRQLQNLVERAVILSQRNNIAVEELQLYYRGGNVNSGVTFDGMTLVEVEEQMVRAALSRHRGSITNAAEELGLTRAALYRRMDKFDIKPEA